MVVGGGNGIFGMSLGVIGKQPWLAEVEGFVLDIVGYGSCVGHDIPDM